MPELPEVESARSFVMKHCQGRKVVDIFLREQGGGPRDGLIDDIVLENNEKGFFDAITHRTLIMAYRKGKNLWLEFDKSDKRGSTVAVLFHFGMTGAFVIQGKEIPTYKAFKVDQERGEWPPKFTKFEVVFEGGVRLAFCDPRRLGRIQALPAGADPVRCEAISKLARDPIIDGVSLDELRVALSKTCIPIKTLLLDQEKVCCGIGNWVADEVLYHSGIHPQTPANSLNENGVISLCTSIEAVLKTAVSVNARSEEFPIDWMFHYRWGKGKNKDARLPNGEKITFVTVGGRTSAIVLSKQPLHGSFSMPTTKLSIKGKPTQSASCSGNDIDNDTGSRKSSLIRPKSDDHNGNSLSAISLQQKGKDKNKRSLQTSKEESRSSSAAEVMKEEDGVSNEGTPITKIKKSARSKEVAFGKQKKDSNIIHEFTSSSPPRKRPTATSQQSSSTVTWGGAVTGAATGAGAGSATGVSAGGNRKVSKPTSCISNSGTKKRGILSVENDANDSDDGKTAEPRSITVATSTSSEYFFHKRRRNSAASFLAVL